MPYKDKANVLRNQRHHYKRRRERALKYLGGVCVHCGGVDDLEFDHIDPKTKSFTVSGRLSHRWEIVVEELKKCQLLCHGCHTNKTKSNGDHLVNFKSWNKDTWKHGTQGGYRIGCRCDRCKLAYSARRREHYVRTGR